MTTDPESTPRDGSTKRVGDEELLLTKSDWLVIRAALAVQSTANKPLAVRNNSEHVLGKVRCALDGLSVASRPASEGEGWRQITQGPDESAAPWNGEPVLICTDHQFGSRVHRAIWTDAVHGHGIHGWAVEDRKFGPYALRGYMNVTHWRPLPTPPADLGGEP